MTTTLDRTTAVLDRINAAMTAADRSKAWTARRAGIPASTLARKLSGRSRLTVKDLVMIARALDVTPEALVGDLA